LCVPAVGKLVTETGLIFCQCTLPHVVRSAIGYHSNSWASGYFLATADANFSESAISSSTHL